MRSARGQILIEILVSFGLLIAGSLMLAGFAVNIRPLASHGPDEMRASFLAEEGLAAARAIRDRDFTLLADGAHGIALTNNQWSFTGPSDAQDEFTRQVTVTTIESRLKKITSTVTGPKSAVTFSTVLSDIRQDTGMAHSVTFDLSNSTLSNGDDGNKELKDIKITNTATSSVTINKVTAWWDDPSALIQLVKLNTNVWTFNGTGSPVGKQPSGTVLDIVDFTLNSGQSENDTQLKFNGPVTTVNFIVQFTFIDGSSIFVTIQPQ